MKTTSILLAALVAAGTAAGCAKSRDREPEAGESGSQPPAPPRIGAQEADRGRKACQGYVDQVCDCALKIPDLTGECDLARSRPKALDMNLRAAMAEGNATEKDRRAIQANARQIAQACLEDGAALVKRGCPMVEGRPAAASPTLAPAPPPEPEPIQDQTR